MLVDGLESWSAKVQGLEAFAAIVPLSVSQTPAVERVGVVNVDFDFGYAVAIVVYM